MSSSNLQQLSPVKFEIPFLNLGKNAKSFKIGGMFKLNRINVVCHTEFALKLYFSQMIQFLFLHIILRDISFRENFNILTISNHLTFWKLVSFASPQKNSLESPEFFLNFWVVNSWRKWQWKLTSRTENFQRIECNKPQGWVLKRVLELSFVKFEKCQND